MRRRNRASSGEEHRQGLPRVMDLLAERYAFDILHRDEGRALTVANLVDVGDAGVIPRLQDGS
jgi:hypothetical protein